MAISLLKKKAKLMQYFNYLQGFYLPPKKHIMKKILLVLNKFTGLIREMKMEIYATSE